MRYLYYMTQIISNLNLESKNVILFSPNFSSVSNLYPIWFTIFLPHIRHINLNQIGINCLDLKLDLKVQLNTEVLLISMC